MGVLHDTVIRGTQGMCAWAWQPGSHLQRVCESIANVAKGITYRGFTSCPADATKMHDASCG